MKPFYFVVVLCELLYIFNVSVVHGANETDGELDPSQSYCFRFTWLGPEYDNSSNYNGTCSDFLEETNAVGVPCREPLVVTYDATPPDIDYLWEHHQTTVVCRRSRGQVCAKYSYSYNNAIQNVTYMCTKVYDAGSGAVTKGCYTQAVDGYDIELCVCDRFTGLYKPCNGAISLTLPVNLIVAIILFSYLINCL